MRAGSVDALLEELMWERFAPLPTPAPAQASPEGPRILPSTPARQQQRRIEASREWRDPRAKPRP